MTTLRIFAYMISPIGENGVTASQFQAIDIAHNTAELLAKLYNGKTDCSSCGCVQYSDTLTFDNLSEESLKVILTAYPFIRHRKYQLRG